MDSVERTIASVAYWEARRSEESEEWAQVFGHESESVAALRHARAHGYSASEEE